VGEVNGNSVSGVRCGVAVQDDAREFEMIELFGLNKPINAGRGGTDAELDVDGSITPFELKSSSTGSVTTVRDFGPDHIAKWKDKHWLFGFYDRTGTRLIHSMYGSPKLMEPWIREKADYISPDFEIASASSEFIRIDIVHRILGEKDRYSLSDTKKIQKRQLNTTEYNDLMDIANGYSPQRMLQIVRDRCLYLLRRGATLNNPHIPESYFAGWERITDNHAARLLEMVRIELGD